MLKVVKPLMIVTGLWKPNLVDVSLFKKIYPVYVKFMKINLVVWLVSMSIGFARLYIQKDDQWMSSAAIFLSYTEMLVKYSIFTVNKVPDLFENIQTEENKMSSNNNESLLKSYSNQARICKGLHLFVVLNAAVTAVLFFFSGMANSLQSTDPSSTSSQINIYPIWLPLEKDIYPAILFFINCLLGTTGGATYVSIIMILITLFVFSASQMESLQIKLKNIEREGPGTSAHLRLKLLIQEHQKWIEYVENVSESVKYVLLMEYVLNAIVAAAIGLQLINSKSIQELLFAVFFMTTVNSQIYFLAWTANEVKIQSEDIGKALYEINWYNYDLSFQKDILIMMVRCQKPLTMKLGPFSAMTLDHAIMATKATYSYMTLMQNV